MKTVSRILGLFGVFAGYELFFNMDIPPLILVLFVSVVMMIAYPFTAIEVKPKAIPVTVIKNATPVSVSGGDNK